MDTTTLRIHGRPVRVLRAGAGSGQALVLLHGFAGNADEWRPLVQRLPPETVVVAPDLPGHGASGRLRGDHSIGAFASWLRDVLEALDVERATFVGHSLGGGIVMQFAYQFPQYAERLVLVSSGGLGREVSPIIRMGGLPGASTVLRFVAPAAARLAPPLSGLGRRSRGDYAQMAQRAASFTEDERRVAFVRAVRAVTSRSGQRVSAADRLYLAAEVPTLIVWGQRDRIIPVAHAHAAHEAMAGSRLVVLDAGHFPHLDQPERVAQVLEDFVSASAPAVYDRERLRARLVDGGG